MSIREAFGLREWSGTPFGHWIYEPETQGISCSDKWLRVIGYADNRLRGPTFMDLLHPEDRPVVREDCRQALITARVAFQNKFRARREDGSYARIAANWRTVYAPTAPAGRVLIGAQSDASLYREVCYQLDNNALAARASERRLELLMENIPGGLFEFVIDEFGVAQFTSVSAELGEILGTRTEELLENANIAFRHQHPEDTPAVRAAIAKSFRELSVLRLNYRLNHPKLGQRWHRVHATPKARPEGGVIWYSRILDATEEMERERELQNTVKIARDTSARLERLTENVPGGIFEFLMTADGKMSFPFATSGMGKLLGLSADTLMSEPEKGFAHIHPDDFAGFEEAIEVSRNSLGVLKHSYRTEHPEHGLRWVRAHSTPVKMPDDAIIWYGSLFDVTEEVLRAQELELARNRMEQLSLIDSLTRLPNRRACDEELARRITEAAECGKIQTVIRIDLDHFKAVNDTLGHSAGDAVLCRVGECIREVVEGGDFAARLGGDEFILLLAPGKGQLEAEAVIKRLREAVLTPFMFEGRHCRFDASFGYASTEELSDDLSEMLSLADAALLTAKEAGRGRAAVFTADMYEGLIQNRRRASEIQVALDREEFVPYFQPQIDAATGQLSGFEVLARWHHPVEGRVLPDDFIPVAQQMRVVQDIDKMMFTKALATLDRLQAARFTCPKLSFNVSAGRIHDPDIVQSVQSLQTRGTRIAFELLESILLEEEGAIFEHHIDLLKENGIKIEVDDFGSGRASIIGVLRVAPDTIKIDRRLIKPLFDSKSMRGLVRAIIDIGQSLDIQITAEGVETMDHAWALREMGCQTLQGFAFAKPMHEEDLKPYVEAFEPVFEGRGHWRDVLHDR